MSGFCQNIFWILNRCSWWNVKFGSRWNNVMLNTFISLSCTLIGWTCLSRPVSWCSDGLIKAVGPAETIRAQFSGATFDKVIDATGMCVLPGECQTWFVLMCLADTNYFLSLTFRKCFWTVTECASLHCLFLHLLLYFDSHAATDEHFINKLWIAVNTLMHLKCLVQNFDFPISW